MMFHRSLTFILLIGASMGYAEYCRKSLTSVNLHTHLTMTCGYTMSGEDFEVSLDIKMCRENPSIVFGIKIGNNVDWEETFTDSAVKVAIPGLSGVYLSVKLEDKPGREKVFLEMELLGKIPVTIISTELEASNCNSRDMTKNNTVVYWWNSLAGGAQAGCIGGAVLLFVLVLVCCCKCCGCCCFKKAPQTTNTIMMNAPQKSNQPSINISNNSSTATQQHMAQPQRNPAGRYFVNPMTQQPPAHNMSGNVKYQKM